MGIRNRFADCGKGETAVVGRFDGGIGNWGDCGPDKETEFRGVSDFLCLSRTLNQEAEYGGGKKGPSSGCG
jgi:hypothetical protein